MRFVCTVSSSSRAPCPILRLTKSVIVIRWKKVSVPQCQIFSKTFCTRRANGVEIQVRLRLVFSYLDCKRRSRVYIRIACNETRDLTNTTSRCRNHASWLGYYLRLLPLSTPPRSHLFLPSFQWWRKFWFSCHHPRCGCSLDYLSWRRRRVIFASLFIDRVKGETKLT